MNLKGLSTKQKTMLVRMKDGYGFKRSWPNSPRKSEGWRHTLRSLQRKDLVKELYEGESFMVYTLHVEGPGWVLTQAGYERSVELEMTGVRP